MSTERLIPNRMAKSHSMHLPHASSQRHCAADAESNWIFDELPKATILSVSKPDPADFSPILLSYTIEVQYKQFKWCLYKKASQVLFLHFALKKRAFIEELHEKQEQVKEWLQSLGIVDQMAVVPDDDEPDDGAVPVNHAERTKNRYVPSRAALPIIRPSLGKQQTISDRAKVAMHNYLNHFLGNLDIVNSREVCKFLEVSKLSFSLEYGPKLKEGYVFVKHLGKISRVNEDVGCLPCLWFGFCSNNWQKVWAVLKSGFLALLADPFDPEPLDIVVFDILPGSNGKEMSGTYLADQIKERNPLYYYFKVSCGNRCINLRTTSSGKVKSWVSAINNAAQKPPEGWCNPHRFGSYAPPRGLTEDGSQAQWYIDGEAAFEAIASAIEEAKSEIFVTGWWLCPELYLRRPFQSQSSVRLDALLEAKAKQGVQIYILLYKEVPLALKINSFYSKKKLLGIHENVRVLRCPDHFSTGIYLWSHHEKLVIVDYRVCFLGGLDLCFGRHDTTEHKVGDCPPVLWPGKDYYNPRESEPNSWEETATDELDREKYPRMPWHDVHCALWGPPCRDVARHFVQRWNHAKRNKAPNEQTIPLLIPQHHMVIPHYMGRTTEIDIKSENNTEENQDNIMRPNIFSSPSLLQGIPLLLPQEAEHPNNDLNSDHKLNHHKEPSACCESFLLSCKKSKVEGAVHNTQLRGFVDDVEDQCDDPEESIECRMKIKDERLRTPKESDDDDLFSGGLKEVVRSSSQWSAGISQTEDSIQKAYCLLIERAEHFIYIENQFFISGLSGDEVIQNRVLDALYKRIMRAHKEQRCFRVVIVIPLLPGFQGGLDDSGAATVRAIIHWQYRTISREKTSILHHLKILLGDKVHDYISFYGLRSYGRLCEGGPVATSQVYVHSKVMIIDDRAAYVGSSNINDRSLLGSRDSEIGVIVEDKEFVESSMNGEPWKAGMFSHSLRCSLWAEHLGLNGGEICQIRDPIADATYKDLWLSTAKANSDIYDDVFACIPNDNIRSRAALRQSMAYWKEKIGHTTIDLGIAPEKLESEHGGGTEGIDPMERLRRVRGHLVTFPLEFMSQESDLRPVFNESEFYAGPHVYH
ncbi:phospholipase D zeta 2-like [Punica granatum]|uniref:Phospholipase n=1 Tax=Punica granatum TaxID=22663 RepID=A0A6P8BSE1_PUNGR|nr:phospholipase D zeta 2-like [Punica granatum]